MDDLELLREYVARQSEPAFARLVERHVDLVYATCLRRLRDPAAADDATQAVFVDLARRAGRLKPGTVVAGWLYRAAVYEAGRSVRAHAVRRRHEMAAADRRPEATVEDGPREEVGDAVDRALARLREPERVAVVLRYLQGRSLAEVADQMRTTEEAARKRVSRGLDRLRHLLRPAGATGGSFGVAAVERVLSAAVRPAPSAVRAASTRAALAAPGTAASPAALAKGVVMTMTTSKVVTGATVAAVAVLAIGGGAVAVRALRPAADQVVAVGPAVPADAARGGVDWLSAFDRVYGLGAGETLRRVPPPAIPQRQQYWDAQAMAPLTVTDWFVFEWDGTAAHWRTRSVREPTLAGVMRTVCELREWEVAVDPGLAATRLPGDWVYRRGATVGQRFESLGAVVSAAVGRPVHFERRTVDRDAYVVTGQLHLSPLAGYPDDGSVRLVGKPAGDDSTLLPAQQARLGDLLEMIALWTNVRVVNRVARSAQDVLVRYARGDVDVDALPANVAAQTGLTFTRQRLPTPVWVAVDDAAGTQAR